ncbi:hypothetical protein ACFY19_21160 [Streptosporangium saharense]|uniref:hypothetical protein n=1 Tax=Streptosporangium saharense TaxID=1706840 RepID=UPI0036B61287
MKSVSATTAADQAAPADDLSTVDGAHVLIDVTQVRSLQQLAVALSQLRARTGGVSLRRLEDQTRHGKVLLARETVSRLLRGERLAAKEVTMALVRHLGASDQEVIAWERAWERVAVVNDGMLAPPRRSEVAELRELITELQQTVAAQQRQMDQMRERLTRLEGRTSSTPPEPTSASTGLRTDQRRPSRSSSALQWRIQQQMEGLASQAAREAAKELTGQIVSSARSSLEVAVHRQLANEAMQSSREAVKALIGEIVSNARPHLEVTVLRHMENNAALAARDAVNDIVRELP